jgi:hypothetical protein
MRQKAPYKTLYILFMIQLIVCGSAAFHFILQQEDILAGLLGTAGVLASYGAAKCARF